MLNSLDAEEENAIAEARATLEATRKRKDVAAAAEDFELAKQLKAQMGREEEQLAAAVRGR